MTLASLNETPKPKASDSRLQLLNRAFEILEAMAAAGGQATLGDLAVITGLPSPTTHRLLRSLVEQGYVRQLESKNYALGPRLIGLGDVAARMLGACAQPQLEELTRRVGESASLAILDGDSAIYVVHTPSARPLRFTIEVGSRVPLHMSDVGKAILAQLPPAQVRQLTINADFGGITSAHQLTQELDEIRQRGYAVDNGATEAGLRGIAVPVPEAPTPMALSISGPDSRLTAESLAFAVPELHECAKLLLACI